MFYPERGTTCADLKAICAECPVTAECLAYALVNREKYGTWGGKSERQRRRMRRRDRSAAE
jgi:WhiB family redox-sensing transcriptional regulator